MGLNWAAFAEQNKNLFYYFQSNLTFGTMSDDEDKTKDDVNAEKEEQTKNENDKESEVKDNADCDSEKKESDDKESQDEESQNGSAEPEIELTFDELKIKAKQQDEVLKKMKEFVFRTDISATDKVNQVKKLLVPEEDKPKQEDKPSMKRSADGDGAPKPKIIKTGEDGEDNSGDEDRDIDSCVVCGLYLQVFKEDKGKELQHYLR